MHAVRTRCMEVVPDVRTTDRGRTPVPYDGPALLAAAAGEPEDFFRKAPAMNFFSFPTSRASSAYPYLSHLPETTGARALVLGGGGATGNAWLIGVLAGLASEDLDVSTPQLTVGTSAGSTAAAQLASSTPAELYQAIIGSPAPSASIPRPAAAPGSVRVPDQLSRITSISAASSGPGDMHRRMGAAALDLPGASDRELSLRWRSIVQSRMEETDWPQRLVYLTAVQAQGGEPVVFDNSSGVPLVDAVAASCSSGPPYWLGERAYIDGGYRRNENADLAQGYGKVLVLSPLGGRSLHPERWGMQLSAQVDQLRASGSQVQAIVPDAAAEAHLGVNAMNQALRPAAAREGFRQGRELAGELRAFWC